MAEFNLPHLDISSRKQSNSYTSHTRNRGSGSAPRIRAQHGALLLEQLRAAFREVQETPAPHDEFHRCDGSYYEIELQRGSDAEALDRKSDGIYSGATKRTDQDTLTTVLFVPDGSIPSLEEILEDYRAGPLTGAGRPRRQQYVEPIEQIRRARLFSFWTDKPDFLPVEPQAQIWWEIWCMRAQVAEIVETLQRIGCQIASDEYFLFFPEVAVVPVFARRADIEVALFACKGITELRRGSDTPTFFLEEERENQHQWSDNLASRIIWPGANAPRVCLLDTGVNRAHPLIEPALSERDLLSVDPAWVPTDNQRESHGTEMAGLALHGDLFAALQDTETRQLTHRLESVRVLPADGFPQNQPARLSTITMDAVAEAEIRNPESSRVFCMAITNEEVSGERGTSWSATIDRASAGRFRGEDPESPKRLFLISAGNIPAVTNVDQLDAPDAYPIEDPAQAWNTLTVGGYTDKQLIDDDGLEDYQPLAAAGDISPFSRNSLAWPSGKAPIKPEIVMEAGNRARSPNGRNFLSCPSLELLTTGADVDRLPIVNFAATSAATALAARLAARLQGDHPNYWPETIRALIVHSASWTERMKARFNAASGLRERQRLARFFGYGVPSYRRATASARNHLALIAQHTIQPFAKTTYVGFNECHYYPLPWPKRILEQYAEQEFVLRVTLSYFIEPNPGRAAAIDPQKYQSFGLRFDLKRADEPASHFLHWTNADENAPASLGHSRNQDDGWMFGPTNISAGSIHCDEWRGSGAKLAARDMICVRPVSGWWKERRDTDVCEQKTRYALILTLASPEVDIDLYTPIQTVITPQTEVPIVSDENFR